MKDCHWFILNLEKVPDPPPMSEEVTAIIERHGRLFRQAG
jgi:hypothetical protein